MSNSSDFQNASQFEIKLMLLLTCSERREEKEEKRKQARLLDDLLKTASPVSFTTLSELYMTQDFFCALFLPAGKADKQHAHEFCLKVHQLQQIWVGLPLQSIQ